MSDLIQTVTESTPVVNAPETGTEIKNPPSMLDMLKPAPGAAADTKPQRRVNAKPKADKPKADKPEAPQRRVSVGSKDAKAATPTADTGTKGKKQAVKDQTSAAENIAMVTYYRLAETPKGKGLFAYWVSILTVLGAMDAKRKPFRASDAKAFFSTGSVISHHTKVGNLEDAGAAGMIRLSAKGLGYFVGRTTGAVSGQEVYPAEIEALTTLIKTGKWEKSNNFPVKPETLTFSVMA